MKIATLGLVFNDFSDLLLGEKKKGEIGTGILTGGGGKQDPGETLEECLLREHREELEIELEADSLCLVAVIDFYAGVEVDFRVYVYLARIASGELHETADMKNIAWYPRSAIPYDKMFPADRLWLPKILAGETFRANIYYLDRAQTLNKEKPPEFFPL